MITQFGQGGISILFDKSTFQSLSYDEILLLHKYFWVNISPILVKEILGDLKKNSNEKEELNKKVIEFANKLYHFNSSVNTSYVELIERELLGDIEIPLYRPVVNTAELLIMPNGKKAAKIHNSEERNALDRWKLEDFKEAEMFFSQYWRETTTQFNLLKEVKEFYINKFPHFGKLKTQEDILKCFDQQFNLPEFHLTTLQLFIEEFSIAADKAGSIFYRWETSREKDIRLFV